MSRSTVIADDVQIIRMMSDGEPVRCDCGFLWLRPYPEGKCPDCKRDGQHSVPVPMNDYRASRGMAPLPVAVRSLGPLS